MLDDLKGKEVETSKKLHEFLTNLIGEDVDFTIFISKGTKILEFGYGCRGCIYEDLVSLILYNIEGDRIQHSHSPELPKNLKN